MRLLLRLRDGRDRATDPRPASPPVDLELHCAEDVTVGELAAALARHLDARPGPDPGPEALAAPVTGTTATDNLARAHPLPGRATLTLRVGGHDLPAGEAVEVAGPPSGSEVLLVTGAGRTGAAPPSGRWLVDAAGRRTALTFGRARLDDAVLEVGRSVVVHRRRAGPVLVNGATVVGPRTLDHGDLLRTAGGVRTVAIDVDAPGPPAGGATTSVEPGAPWAAGGILAAETPLVLPETPEPPRRPGLPLLSATVPLLTGLVLWWATRSATTAVLVVLTCVVVLAAALESRREARAERRARLAGFHRQLAAASAEVDRRAAAVRAAATARHPPPATFAGDELPAGRLWGATEPVVRLGEGPGALDGLVELPPAGRAEPAAGTPERAAHDALEALVTRTRAATTAVVVDLDGTGGLVVVGPAARAEQVLRSVVVQAVTSVDPSALGVVAGPSRSWAAWLPHAAPGASAPRRLVLVEPGAPWPRAAHGDLLLAVAPSGHPHPPGVAAALVLGDGDGGGNDVLRRPDRPDVPLTAEGLGLRAAEHAARRLSPLRADVTGGAAAGTPDRVALRDVVPADGTDDPFAPAVVAARWAAAARTGRLDAPVGRSGPATVHLDLATDGPHALVAGTTGAGKSELLRTLVASLAAHHGPDRCTFLLVDYKGGAAFGPLAGLPHTTGVVTDLDATLAARALASLGAEVRRRERLAADGRPAAAALVVVVDEFATLARDLPEFVDGLVDVAQRGRSLGVHLVLATQHPAGVVGPAIRANTSLRVALRTTDAEASTDVVDVPDAARLPRHLPGRAVVRTAPGTAVEVQTAWTGSPAHPPARVVVAPLGAGRPTRRATGRTELEAVVEAARQAAAHLPPPRRPWQDPLPATLLLDDLLGPAAPLPGTVVVGLADRPDHQDQVPAQVRLDVCGGLAVVGAPGSGRSTALRTVVAGLLHHDATAGPGCEVHVVDGDGRPGGPGDLAAHPAVGSVVDVADVERTLRLLRRLRDEVDRRRADQRQGARAAGTGRTELPTTVLVVDEVGRFDAVHERCCRGLGVDLLVALAADGPPVGVHVVASARRPGDLHPLLGAALRGRLLLRPAHEDEAVLAGLPPWAADPRRPPGRGHLDGLEVQVALAGPPPPASGRRPAAGVGRIGDAVELAATAAADDPWRVPVAVHADTLGPVDLDLRHAHAVVAGPRRSGVTTALASLAGRCPAAAVLMTDRPVPGPWDLLLPPDDLAAASDPAGLLEHLLDGRPALVLVDGADRLLDGPGAAALDAALGALVAAPFGPRTARVVLGGDADLLARTFAESWTRVRACRTGLLLRVDPDLGGVLLHTTLPRRDELAPRAGRGWCVGPDGADPAQVAVPLSPRGRPR